MIIKNAKIVLFNEVLENASIKVSDGKIEQIGNVNDIKEEEIIDLKGNILMPGFIDLHIHGSMNIDFMDAKAEDYKIISNSLYKEGVTTYLATTLTSDKASLENVAKEVKKAKKENPSLLGIHLEGPYISVKHKGAQNEAFIRNPDINELKNLIEISDNNIRYITLAPEKEGSLDFIKEATKLGVTCSVGHTDATFIDVKKAIECGLSNVTHTHNAMSGYHHRNPGVVNAAMYFDTLNCELICDGIHVCKETIQTFYKIVGPDRFMIITDALKIKHSDVNEFTLFGLPCVRKDGAAYLKSGPLAGSLLNFDQGLRNMKDWCSLDLISLAKISSSNQARSLHLDNIGQIKVGYNADFVVLNDELNVLATYKNGKKVY